jgi:hypothetical protein
MFALSKERDCEAVGKWIKSICNHMYWCAASTPTGDGEVMAAKWNSVTNHIQNIHQGHGQPFDACSHGRLTGRERKKKWMKPGNYYQ